jgi:hypothetical protein
MGIVDFREQMLPQFQRRFEARALTQAADALFVTCSEICVWIWPPVVVQPLSWGPAKPAAGGERWESSSWRPAGRSFWFVPHQLI